MTQYTWDESIIEEQRQQITAQQAENARLRDVLGNLLIGIETHLGGNMIDDLNLYGPADAWFKGAINAARREFKEGEPVVYQRGGLDPLSAEESPGV